MTLIEFVLLCLWFVVFVRQTIIFKSVRKEKKIHNIVMHELEELEKFINEGKTTVDETKMDL